MTSRLARRVCACLAAAAFATPASAQREAGPYGPLLGGSPRPQSSDGSTLALRWRLNAAYDDQTLYEAQQLDADRFQENGYFTTASTEVSFDRRAGRAAFGFAGSASAHAYGASGWQLMPTYGGRAALELPLTRSTTLQTSAGASYASFYQFVPFVAQPIGGTPSPAIPDTAAAESSDVLSTWLGAGMTQSLGGRSSLSADAGWRRTVFDADDGLDAWAGRLTFRQGLTRGLGLHAAYGLRQGNFDTYGFGAQNGATMRDIDVGVDFAHALSLSRKTTLSVGTGSSFVESQDTSEYRLNGQASLNHQFGRTWSASLTYARGSGFVDGFNDVVFSDSASATAGGMFGRRAKFDAGVTATNGRVGSQSSGPAFDSYNATATLSVGVSRHLGLYTQYVFSYYDIPSGVSTFERAPRMNRQALMVGISGWIPLTNTARSRDTR